MQRIAILGCSGGGKSTLARRLGERLGLPVTHLDAIHWLPGWVERDKAETRAIVAEIVAAERWIIEGNYTHLADLRLTRADTIVVIDRSRWLCLWRVIGRWLTHLGRTRADMGKDCPEKLDWAFVRFIWNYPRRNAPQRDASIAQHGAHARLVRLNTDRQIAAFLSAAKL